MRRELDTIEMPDEAWGYLPYINGPFTWNATDRTIRDCNNHLVDVISISTYSDGPALVTRWNEKYAEWLMVKPDGY